MNLSIFPANPLSKSGVAKQYRQMYLSIVIIPL